MSDLFDEEPEEPTTRRPGRRARALVITGGVLLFGFFALTAFAAIYTDRLWFREVGYGQVFSTMLWTRVGLFLVFGVLMGAAVAVNMHLAYRFRPLFRMPGADGSVDRYRDAVTPIRTWLLLGVAVVVGAFAGTSALGQWRTYLLWRNGQPWGEEDAYFGRDIGFFVFDLPWWHYVVDFVMAAAVVSVIATAVVHYLYGGIRLQVQHDRLSGAAQVQFSVLLGIFVLAKAVDYYLDRFDLVTDDHALFTGMNYTAENALLPARNILMGVAVICAILFFLNVWRRTWQLPSVGLALLALSAVLLGMIWPAIVQNFQVNPTEADKEATYIENNIAATRAAYDLEDLEIEPYTSNSSESGATVAELVEQVDTTPLVDPQLVRQTFEQRQQPRDYYSVAPVLDVDRYEIEDNERALVLGVRELDQAGLSEGDQNWLNLHTVYTHGSGLIAAYANQRPTSNREAQVSQERTNEIKWAEGLGEDALREATGGYRPEIYYGENSPEYSVVGKPSDDAPSVELGLAGGADDEEPTTYSGEGGVRIGGLFNQLMYTVKYGEPNFLLSQRVHDNSRLLYVRHPAERVRKVAPWLTLDSDPYPAVVDGEVKWIIDGFTTTDDYPNAERESFSEMIDDSLQEDTGFQTVPTDEINYMRQAVKATVDAYDGTVDIYAWDESDPILQAWRSIFPDVVKDSDEMPDELREHLRYPEDLFKAQRYQLARYHVDSASDWYQGNNRWEVPNDPYSSTHQQPPYRLFTRGDGTSPDEQWSITSVFEPYGELENLTAYMSVNSDATSPEFGKIRIYQLADTNTQGPGQIANEIANDDHVRDELREYELSASEPIHGNLLTLPVRDGLIHIEPIYAVRGGTGSSYPILQFVVVAYGNEVGVGRTLTDALADAIRTSAGQGDEGDQGDEGNQGDQGNEGDQGDQGNEGGQGEGGGPDGPESSLVQQIEEAHEAAQEARSDGDMAEWARQMELLEDLVQRWLDQQQAPAGE